MEKQITFREFQKTGLLLPVNELLHPFGIQLVFRRDVDTKEVSMDFERTKNRGFSDADKMESIEKIKTYLKENYKHIRSAYGDSETYSPEVSFKILDDIDVEEDIKSAKALLMLAVNCLNAEND